MRTPAGDEADVSTHDTNQRRLLALASDLTARFDDVRLPIHILLENRFGELNENQEEMLEAARVAAEIAGESLRRLRELVELELGTLVLTPVRQRSDDVFRSVVSAIAADAERAGLQLTTSVASPLPAIRVDAARVREALTLLVADAIGQSPPGSTLGLAVSARESDVTFTLTAPAFGSGIDRQLALALLTAQHAHVESTPHGAAIIFPVAAADRLSPLISIV
jgi:signal transduction histidine kinase